MKKYIAFFIIIAVVFIACNQTTKYSNDGTDTAGVYAMPDGSATAQTQQSEYASYGAKISPDEALAASDVAEKYASLKEGDTALVKFEAPISSVCAAKGCWMRLDAGEEEVFVKFKDYGFFVPLDAEGDAIVKGKAYLEEVTVDELQHMAEDAGKSKEEIAAITEPKRELRFMADGVLIKGK